METLGGQVSWKLIWKLLETHFHFWSSFRIVTEIPGGNSLFVGQSVSSHPPLRGGNWKLLELA